MQNKRHLIDLQIISNYVLRHVKEWMMEERDGGTKPFMYLVTYAIISLPKLNGVQ